MRIGLLVGLACLAAAGCQRAPASSTSATALKRLSLPIFYTGNVQGEFEPCG